MNPAHLHLVAAALAAVAFTFTLADAAKKSVRFGKIVLTEQDLGDDIITAKNSSGWGLAWFEQMKATAGGIPFAERRSMGTRDEKKPCGVACSQPPAPAPALALALADLSGDGPPAVLTAAMRGVLVALNPRRSPQP